MAPLYPVSSETQYRDATWQHFVAPPPMLMTSTSCWTGNGGRGLLRQPDLGRVRIGNCSECAPYNDSGDAHDCPSLPNRWEKAKECKDQRARNHKSPHPYKDSTYPAGRCPRHCPLGDEDSTTSCQPQDGHDDHFKEQEEQAETDLVKPKTAEGVADMEDQASNRAQQSTQTEKTAPQIPSPPPAWLQQFTIGHFCHRSSKVPGLN